MIEKMLNRKKELLVGIIALVIIIFIVSFLIPKNADIEEVFNKLKSQPEVSSRIKNHVFSEKESEDDIAAVNFQDELLEDNNAIILLCGSEEEAEVFQYYFEETSKQEKAIRDKEEYGNYFREVDLVSGRICYVFKVDNCVMYLPITVGDEVASLYQKAFESTVKSLNFDHKDYSVSVESAKNNVQSNIEKNVSEYMIAIDESITKFKTSGDSELNTLKTSMNETSLKQFKEKYLSVEAPIFKDKLEEWKKSIEDIEKQITEEKKKRKRREPSKAHNAGVHKVGIDSF